MQKCSFVLRVSTLLHKNMLALTLKEILICWIIKWKALNQTQFTYVTAACAMRGSYSQTVALTGVIHHLLNWIHTFIYVIKKLKILPIPSVSSKCEYEAAIPPFTKNTHFLHSATSSEVSLFNTFTVHLSSGDILYSQRHKSSGPVCLPAL